MFECMDIYGSIYECIVEPSYEKPTRSYSNRAGHIRQKRIYDASSQTYSEISERAHKRIKRYLYRPAGGSKTCIHHMNERFWETLVIRMLKVNLLKTMVIILYQE